MNNQTEKNKKIALFMGAIESNFGEYLVFNKSNVICIGKVGYSDLKYDTDWSWLMPVFEKISENGYQFSITHISVEIKNTINSTYWIKNIGGFYDIEDLITVCYNAVIDFINEYNKKSKKRCN